MDQLKHIWEYIYDKLYKASRKFDGVNEYIFEKTGAKVNVGMIVFAIIFTVLIAIFVKAILSIVFGKLYSGDY